MGINIFLLPALVGAAMLRAAPLPPNAIEENTVLLMRIDLARIDPTSVRAVVRDVMSSAAPQSAPAADAGMAGLQIAYEAITSAGLEAVNVVLTARKDNQPPDWFAYLQIRPGSDEAAIRKMLTEHSKPEEIPKFAHAGAFLLAYGHDQELPIAGSGARARIFGEAMTEAGKNATVTIAFIPNDQIRSFANVIPTAGLNQQVADMIPFLLKSRWVLLVASLGKSPGVGATIRAEDEAGAEYLTEKLRGLSGSAGEESGAASDTTVGAAKPHPAVKHPAGTATRTDAVEVGAIHPIRKGAKVSFSLQGAALRQLAAALVPSAEHAQQKSDADEARDHLRALCAAMSLYAKAHNGLLPDNIQQLRPFVDKDRSFDDLIKNPRTGSNPGFIYVKPAGRMANIRDPVHTPVFFEAKNGAKDPGGAVGYATGQINEARDAGAAGN